MNEELSSAQGSLPNSDFARFAKQSFQAARTSSTHSRRSLERIKSIHLPHYLQLEAVADGLPSCQMQAEQADLLLTATAVQGR